MLQIVEWATIGFGPTDGGFASVFLGWTGLYVLFVSVCTCTGSRRCSPRRSATAVVGPQGTRRARRPATRTRTGDDIDQPLSLVGPSSRAFAFYWTVLAGIGVVTWFILYLL